MLKNKNGLKDVKKNGKKWRKKGKERGVYYCYFVSTSVNRVCELRTVNKP